MTNGKVLVEGHEIGYLTLYTGELKIDFYDFVTVTSAEVKALVHNLTYLDPDGAFIEGPDITVSVTDNGQRASTSIVHVAGHQITAQRSRTRLTLSATTVVECA